MCVCVCVCGGVGVGGGGGRSVHVCVCACKITEGLSMLQCNGQLEQKSAGPSSLSVCLITAAHAPH